MDWKDPTTWPQWVRDNPEVTEQWKKVAIDPTDTDDDPREGQDWDWGNPR